ncbi:MAG: hypothetical protein MRJ67_15725 [Nitrospirales bacterium]|nr:hypothetical protein [Nitrospira sp.]MDR4461942.1 hypothetical protein [Nitrospirales bacterium]
MVCFPAHYPGIRLEELYPDWQGSSHFRVEVYSGLPVARSLIIRIDDSHHNHEYADRFNQAITISPGLTHNNIPLDDIRHTARWAGIGSQYDQECYALCQTLTGRIFSVKLIIFDSNKPDLVLVRELARQMRLAPCNMLRLCDGRTKYTTKKEYLNGT